MRDGEGEAGGVVDSPTVRRHPAVPALHHLHTVLYSATKRRFYIAYDRFIREAFIKKNHFLIDIRQ